MPKRPCLDCGVLTTGSRCEVHQRALRQRMDAARGTASQRGLGSAWRTLARNAVAQHRQMYGDWCPGWHNRGAHRLGSGEYLTADHIVARAANGAGAKENIQVLCNRCNTAKGRRSS